jgi:hypothetical protein
MIDNFALALSHGLIALAVWRLMRSDSLDHEECDQAELAKPEQPGA